jgi:hypothetical protein
MFLFSSLKNASENLIMHKIITAAIVLNQFL